MGRLYIAANVFAPSLIRPALAPDDYSHDAKALHLVLQPMLLEWVSGADPGIEPLSIGEYFKSWADPDPARPAPVLVGKDLATRIQSGEISATPVPLPPGTRLKFALKTDPALPGGAWSDERTVGLTTPNGSPVVAWDQLKVDTDDGWPGFAARSAALPLVRRYEDLALGKDPEPSRQEIVRRWLVGLFSVMSDTANTGPDWRKYAKLETVWKEVSGVGIPFSDIGAWDTWLATNAKPANPPPAARLYPKLIEVYNEIAPRKDEKDRVLKTRPPRFEFRSHEIRCRRELFDGGLPISGRAYLHALWSELTAQVKRADGQKPDDAKETLLRVVEACGRFFGFGERLAWPRHHFEGLGAPEALRRFMVLREKLDEDWLITNGVSLAGLVFRIDGMLPGTKLDGVELESFQVQLPGAVAADVEPWKSDNVQDLLEEALLRTQNLVTDVPASGRIEVKPVWKVAYDGGGTRTDRAVYWQLREGALLPMLDPSVPASATKWYAVPPALLDLADDSRRSPSAKRLSADTDPPRRALRRKDLVRPVAAKGLRLQLPGRLAPFNTGEGAVLSAGGLAYEPFRVYALQLEKLHPRDNAAEMWLADLPTSGRDVEIWITPKDKTKPPIPHKLVPKILSQHPFEAASVLILDDNDGTDPLNPGPLTTALGETEQGQAKPTDALVWSVDVIFAASGGEPFNIAAEPAIPTNSTEPAPLWLASGLVTRLGLSTDRILQPVAVTWTPEFDPDGAEKDGLQANYAADTNKLRLAIPGFAPTGVGRKDLLISDPDALLPLPDPRGEKRRRPHEARGPVERKGPQAWYWAAYHLDQDRDVSKIDEEAWRFHAWVDAGRDRVVAGYVEHQFGLRIPLAQELAADLRRAVDIVHPANVNPRGRTEKEPDSTTAPGGESEVQRRPLVRFCENSETKGFFEAHLQRKAIRLAIERLKAPEADPAGRGKAADGGRFTAIRSIYRALADLRDAIANGEALLVVEGWRFDNRLQRRLPSSVDLGLPEPQTAPNVIGSLDLDFEETVVVSAPPPGSPLAKVFSALDESFEDFVTVLENIAAPESTSTDADDSDWALLAYKSLPDLHKRVHYVRARLTLTRQSDRTPDQAWAEAVFVPLMPLQGPTALTEAEEKTLAKVARSELAAWLKPPDPTLNTSPSRLWRSSLPLEAAERACEQGLTLGDNAQTLIAPEGQVSPDPWVSDLFYVPHAFLVPAAHPSLRDRQGTADFATWLVALAETLAAGGDARGFIAQPAANAAAKVDLRGDVRRLVRNPKVTWDLVRRLEALLIRVERAQVGSGASNQESLLFDHVARVVEAADEGEDEQRWSDVRAALLQRRPSLFGKARAIALGIFNSKVDETVFSQDNFNPQVFSVQLTKHAIRDGETVKLSPEELPTETERFDFTRFHLAKAPFFVDVLPEGPYDDLLVIGQNRYTGVDPGDFDQLGLPRKRSDIAISGGVLQRGDAAAVSAERVIDEDGRPPAGLSDVEVNLVHYNPDWRTRFPEPRFLYVLPERRIPATPRTLGRVLRRRGTTAAADDPEVGYSPIRLQSPSGRPNLKTAWLATSKTVFDSLKKISVPAGDRAEAYGRVRTVPNLGGPLWSHESGPEGWQLLTTYATHHWFSLGLERPEESLQVNFEGDVLDLEVEFWRKAPPVEDLAAVPSLPSEPLVQWFDYGRRIAAGETGLDMPDPVSATQVVQSLRNWLVEAPENAPYLGRTVLEPPTVDARAADGEVVVRRTFRLRAPNGPDKPWPRIEEKTELPGHKRLGELGACLGFEVYGATGDDGRTPAWKDKGAGPFAVLRFTMLDHPFHIARVRLRRVRNAVDVNGDSRIDVDERFVLSDRASVWSQKRIFLELGPADFAASKVLPHGGASIYVRPTGKPVDWLTAWLRGDATLAADVGAALTNVFSIELEDYAGHRFPLWERPQLLSELTVSGSVTQPFVDSILPQYGLDGRDEAAGGARVHEDIRQLIPPMPGKDLPSYIANTLSPSLVDTLEPLFILTWRDGDNIPAFRTTLTMRVGKD
jgi:hypothetical protein